MREKTRQKYIAAGIDPLDPYAKQKYYLKTRKGKRAHNEFEKQRREVDAKRIKKYELSDERKEAKADWARKNRRYKYEVSEFLLLMHSYFGGEYPKSRDVQLRLFYLKYIFCWLLRDRRKSLAIK